MRTILNILFIAIGFIYPFAISAQQVEKVKVDDFDKWLGDDKNPQLIDVRTPEEYKKGHLKNALNLDWNSPEFDNMTKALNKDQPVYIYCLGGSRSEKAAEKMRESGFKEIYELQGGIVAWNNAAKPVTVLAKSTEPEITLDEYTRNLRSDKLVLVDFNAPWCAPCKKMAPMLEELSHSEKDNMQLIKINIDDQKALAKSLDVMILPTLILYRNNEAVWRHEGLIEKEALLEIIRKN